MIYQKYILKHNLQYFLLIATILICLVWFSKTVVFLHLITQNGISIKQFLLLFILIFPWILSYILPFSLLAANILAINNLQQNSEVTVLKSSSVSNLNLAKPIILLGLLISLISYSISFYFMPYANRQLKLFKNNLQENYSNISLQSGVFENIKNITIYVKKREKDDLFGLFIYDQSKPDYAITITAKDAKINTSNNSLSLILNNGTLQKFNPNNEKTEILYFQQYLFNLNENENIKNQYIHFKPKERYFHELIYPEHNLPQEYLAILNAEVHQRLIFPITPLIFSLLSAIFLLKTHSIRGKNLKNTFYNLSFALMFFFINLAIKSISQNNANYIIINYLNCFIFLVIPIFILSNDKKYY
jgi:lipopolysaccharide export system permease protein